VCGKVHALIAAEPRESVARPRISLCGEAIWSIRGSCNLKRCNQSLIFKGETLGVLAVFSRAHIDQEQL